MAKSGPYNSADLPASKRPTDDLAKLEVLDDKTMLSSLDDRYAQDAIYTFIGDILIAINPFKDIDVYNVDFARWYVNAKKNFYPPHIYAVADAAYQQLVSGKGNQCVVISGMSGAGKTESTKHLLRHMIGLCRGHRTGLEWRVVQSNPLLEAFGNAKTVMNDNSSRFGRFVELKFRSADGALAGGTMCEYLLEKSRVVSHARGERSFHVFYYMLCGSSPEERKRLRLNSIGDYRYLMYPRGEPPMALDYAAGMYSELRECMKTVGLSKSEMDDIFSILSAILHLGNLEFVASPGCDDSTIAHQRQLDVVAELLGLDEAYLTDALTVRTTRTNNEKIRVPYSVAQSEDARDAMAKALYERVFSWIVCRVNELLSGGTTTLGNGNLAGSASADNFERMMLADKTLKGGHDDGAGDDGVGVIGILDIFGFENFERNSFEQLCINVANESLQHHFNSFVFDSEKKEYVMEGLHALAESVSFVSNYACVDMFLAKPIGLFALLDEESKFPKGTDVSLLEKINTNLEKNAHFEKSKKKGNNFTIAHYAGKVTYDTTGFLQKNRDNVPEAVTTVLRLSACELVNEMFKAQITKTGSLMRPKSSTDSGGTGLGPSSRKGYSIRKALGKSGGTHHVSGTTKQGKDPSSLTVAGKFKYSLGELMVKIVESTPHFVRCIKPNSTKRPGAFDHAFVHEQLRYVGAMETVRIRKQGYAIRPTFVEFLSRYKPIAFHFTDNVPATAASCDRVLKVASVRDYSVGRDRLFLRYWAGDELDRWMEHLKKSATKVQKIFRGWRARRHFSELILRHRKKFTFDRVVSEFGKKSKDGPIGLRRSPRVSDADDTINEAGEAVAAAAALLAGATAAVASSSGAAVSRPPVAPRPLSRPPPVRGGDSGTSSPTAVDSPVTSNRRTSLDVQSQPRGGPPERSLTPTPTLQVSSPSMSPGQQRGGTQLPKLGMNDSWYHGPLGRTEAESTLASASAGAWLVRDSSTADAYSLSVKCGDGTVRHFLIISTESGYQLSGHPRESFTSIPNLLQFFSTSPIPNTGEVLYAPIVMEDIAPSPRVSRASLSPGRPGSVSLLISPADSGDDSDMSSSSPRRMSVRKYEHEIEEAKRLLEIEMRIADAANRLAAEPTDDKKVQRKRKENAETAAKNIERLRARLEKLEGKQAKQDDKFNKEQEKIEKKRRKSSVTGDASPDGLGIKASNRGSATVALRATQERARVDRKRSYSNDFDRRQDSLGSTGSPGASPTHSPLVSPSMPKKSPSEFSASAGRQTLRADDATARVFRSGGEYSGQPARPGPPSPKPGPPPSPVPAAGSPGAKKKWAKFNRMEGRGIDRLYDMKSNYRK